MPAADVPGLGETSRLARSTARSSPADLLGIAAGGVRAPLVVSAAIERPTQNWHGPGESDCLIKTKHCDGRKTVLTQCDFCPVL
jgi:hypothetical protein